jgi:hypothetical protein
MDTGTDPPRLIRRENEAGLGDRGLMAGRDGDDAQTGPRAAVSANLLFRVRLLPSATYESPGTLDTPTAARTDARAAISANVALATANVRSASSGYNAIRHWSPPLPWPTRVPVAPTTTVRAQAPAPVLGSRASQRLASVGRDSDEREICSTWRTRERRSPGLFAAEHEQLPSAG